MVCGLANGYFVLFAGSIECVYDTGNLVTRHLHFGAVSKYDVFRVVSNVELFSFSVGYYPKLNFHVG